MKKKIEGLLCGEISQAAYDTLTKMFEDFESIVRMINCDYLSLNTENGKDYLLYSDGEKSFSIDMQGNYVEDYDPLEPSKSM